MKSMNVQANEQMDKPRSLKEKVISGLSDQITRKAVDPRECWGWAIYEPETPLEIILESIAN